MQTLGVAMGFVGNYAPCGLSPQTDGMPVILKKQETVSDFLLSGAASNGWYLVLKIGGRLA